MNGSDLFGIFLLVIFALCAVYAFTHPIEAKEDTPCIKQTKEITMITWSKVPTNCIKMGNDTIVKPMVPELNKSMECIAPRPSFFYTMNISEGCR